MSEHDIAKALEVWGLQTLLDLSIFTGLAALILASLQNYYQQIEKLLFLRVLIEFWRLITVVLIEVLLFFTVIIGCLTLNPDIMTDIKIAVPFYPLATVLFAVALVLRLFHGGHRLDHPNFNRAWWLMLLGSILNIIGFTFVMEAPADEFLQLHPSAFWAFVKGYLRSNAAPHGLEVAYVTFWICFPLLLLVFVWGLLSARKTNSQK